MEPILSLPFPSTPVTASPLCHHKSKCRLPISPTSHSSHTHKMLKVLKMQCSPKIIAINVSFIFLVLTAILTLFTSQALLFPLPCPTINDFLCRFIHVPECSPYLTGFTISISSDLHHQPRLKISSSSAR